MNCLKLRRTRTTPCVLLLGLFINKNVTYPKKKKKTRTLNIIFLKRLGLLIIKKKYARTSKPKNKMTQKYKIRLMGFGIAKENPFQKKIKI